VGEQKTVLLVDELREIRFRQTEISAYQERIQRLRALAARTTPTMTEGSKGSAVQDRMAEMMAMVVDLEQTLVEKVVMCEARTQAAETEVDKLPRNFREVIRLRDFQGMKWSEIADKMQYDERHCRRIHEYAMEVIRTISLKCPRMSG
jgi:DNA-directed RNA polymerase specialized sigma24 family protein